MENQIKTNKIIAAEIAKNIEQDTLKNSGNHRKTIIYLVLGEPKIPLRTVYSNEVNVRDGFACIILRMIINQNS